MGDRLLDLALVLALRAWCAGPGRGSPAWYGALGDPAVGEALHRMHADPAPRWTVAAVAAVARKVGYEDAFAFGVACKRARGVSPSARRHQPP